MTLQDYFTRYYSIISSGNLDELAQYYHTASPMMDAAKSQWEMMRTQCEFEITLTHIELIAKQENLLVVYDQMQFAGEVNGQQVNRHSSNVHSLAKEAGVWKIFSTSIVPETEE
ncbi:hypothetical protein L1077_21185 [Pseudoalteromonas luteoviolacea]|uniref:hypothetical protein n=1 Tax=Pseudoalteromonas luteoviolacea TaxID=43657 RepID=UPI001F3657A3|nr:hypothetical protein [Pseudoalteromonas luteoviolacea]MCF6441946.1 hypothetical protein [Pseudoalteromonas luteoviolacea]